MKFSHKLFDSANIFRVITQSNNSIHFSWAILYMLVYIQNNNKNILMHIFHIYNFFKQFQQKCFFKYHIYAI